MAVEEPVGPGALRLEELYLRHGAALLRLCRRRLRDPSRAEDACHEALVRASEAADRFRAGAPVWPWLATIAINVCTDMERRDSRISFMADPPDRAAAGDVVGDVDGRTRRGIVRAALASLPLPYRRSVFLHHYAGLSYDEIAEHEGTTTGAVRSRLLRARRLLRVRVEELATRSGDWPLPASAPAGVVRRLQVALGRADPVVSDRMGTAAQYTAALLFAAGVLVGGGSGGSELDRVAPRPDVGTIAPAAADVSASTAAGRVAASGTVSPGRVGGSVEAPGPVPPVQTYLVPPKTIASVTPPIQDKPILIEPSWSCNGGDEPGTVTKFLCEHFPNGITP